MRFTNPTNGDLVKGLEMVTANKVLKIFCLPFHLYHLESKIIRINEAINEPVIAPTENSIDCIVPPTG